MKQAFFIVLLMLLSCKTQTINNINKSNKIPVQNTLVIFEKNRIYTSNANNITDTLSAKYSYQVLTTKEEIRRYTGEKQINKVIVIF